MTVRTYRNSRTLGFMALRFWRYSQSCSTGRSTFSWVLQHEYLEFTAGRRDLMHMRWTTPMAFIRWVGANEPDSSRARLDEWIGRISQWKEAGLRKRIFFVHQNDEQESPARAAHFIKRLNNKIGTALAIPKTLDDKGLFD